MLNAKLILFIVSLSLVCGCPWPPNNKPKENPDGSGSYGVSQTVCGELASSTLFGNAAQLQPQLAVWPVDDTYGVNSFYLWEINVGTGEPIGTSLPAKDWQIPTTDWAAARWNLDGFDPYKFSQIDPFIVSYLPYVPSNVQWKSKFGSTNDSDCHNTRNENSGDDNQNDNDSLIGGRFHCIGANQLDPNSPILQSGRTYLLQLSMIVYLGEDNGYNRNRVQSCYRAIVTR